MCGGPERHLLDEAQLVAVPDRPLQEWHRLPLVHPTQQHCIDLDRVESRVLRSAQASKDVGEAITTGEKRVLRAVQ